MANIFTNALNGARDWFIAGFAPYLTDELAQRGSILASYYQGDHRPQLRTKVGAQDDNITQNFVGLAVDRSVSRLFRGGVQFNLPDGADAQQEYLNKVWDLNKKEIILYQVGLHGAVYGTTYFKICPDELVDPFDGKLYPRLIPLDPEIVRIVTEPQDMNEVREYRIEYMIKKTDKDTGKVNETGYREITRRAEEKDYMGYGEAPPDSGPQGWTIEEWEQSVRYGNQWTLVSTTPWLYNFPPIIHWKNLPSLKSCYGDSDIDDAINVQDKSNFAVSNTSKIIKFHAHPETIVSGVSVSQLKDGRVESGPSTLTAIPADAKAYNLEMNSDLGSSRNFATDLRQSIFDIAREVDMSSISDKLGALTNFGLHVLYTDALDKNDTKRQLYGDALKELNRRLLVLTDLYKGPASDPGKITWGEAMIVNVLEDMQVDELALGLKIIDLETVTKRYQSRYGVDFETVQANIAKQSAADNANNANVGANILKNFIAGKGANGG